MEKVIYGYMTLEGVRASRKGKQCEMFLNAMEVDGEACYPLYHPDPRKVRFAFMAFRFDQKLSDKVDAQDGTAWKKIKYHSSKLKFW